MNPQAEGEGEREFELARKALDREDFEEALTRLGKALELNDNPCWYSYAGYCMAKGRGEFRTGVDLCLISLEHEKENPAHYLNLGKVYLASGNKKKALQAFREGLARGGNDETLKMLIEFGVRNPPVIKSLSRSNPLNKFLGRLFHRRALRNRGLP